MSERGVLDPESVSEPRVRVCRPPDRPTDPSAPEPTAALPAPSVDCRVPLPRGPCRVPSLRRPKSEVGVVSSRIDSLLTGPKSKFQHPPAERFGLTQ